ncbi:hypothetical protein OG905_02125 [Streptomyces sp. NBC_00322]|uniref:hypothetical protein n=1 Tax=Streptomyces sp. NBC_00322 TaxID=2975712 RepID=UPI002E286C7A|nr:hypothetical protein [Streptomyces sp. NBC_00322]
MAAQSRGSTQLFSTFIPAAYRPHPRYPCRWTARQAQAALTLFAVHLQLFLHGTPEPGGNSTERYRFPSPA